MPRIYNAAIVGAGPAGLSAAIESGKRGFKTALLEKKARPAIKLSITGKGRCNLTNCAGIKDFVEAFRNGKFLYGAFSFFSNSDLISFFENLAIPCKLERGGRYFPQSGKASDIAGALIKETKKYCGIICDFCVKSVLKNDGIFIIRSEDGKEILSEKVIIASGGMSYPATGSTGDGYEIAKSFGHSIKDLSPALVPIELESRYLKDLRGLKLKNAEVSVVDASGKKLDGLSLFGEMEFTIYGAGGPVILTLSSSVAEKIKKAPLSLFLSINFKPALSRPQLDKRLICELDKYGRQSLQNMLKELLPVQMLRPFIDYCGLKADRKCSQINKTEREKILDSLFDARFKIKGVRSIKEAIVTRGGVCVDEINPQTMQSKLVKGLYFCGEVIDVDAPTGGYNLQAAFSTGFLAGRLQDN
jgi:predicted Rossmann fold flavoprotein